MILTAVIDSYGNKQLAQKLDNPKSHPFEDDFFLYFRHGISGQKFVSTYIKEKVVC